jgi:hypothetical protein
MTAIIFPFLLFLFGLLLFANVQDEKLRGAFEKQSVPASSAGDMRPS